MPHLAFLPDSCLADAVHPSPNAGKRRSGFAIDMVILHYTGMASAEAAIAYLASPRSEVSSHYLIDEEGFITQMVPEDLRAWHAGRSHWQGVDDINSCSIGIELQNPGHDLGYPEFPAAQMEAVAALCRDIIARHAIAPERVLAHSDVAPERKRDPGEKFDWAWFNAEGVGHYVPPEVIVPGPSLAPGEKGPAVRDLQEKLKGYGYGVRASGLYDKTTEMVVAAFQRHFRPARVDGIADVSTRRTLERLLDALAPGAE